MTQSSDQLILLSVQGPDKPGITMSLMNIIKEGNHVIFDIGQSVTHGLLSLSIVVTISPTDQDHLLKELLFTCKAQGLELNFKVLESEEKLTLKGERYVLSCVSATDINAHFIQEIASSLAEEQINIDRIDSFEEAPLRSLDITTTPKEGVDWNLVKEKFIKVSNKYNIDIAFVKDDIFRYNKRLVIFDMDSTLIRGEVINELAAEAGVEEEVSLITKKAMDGELDFDESLTQRVALLKGLEESSLMKVQKKIELSPGVPEFIKTIQSLGFKTAVISGGFDYFANNLKDHLKLDYAFANQLEVKDGKLTGKVIAPIVNSEYKAFLLNFITQKEGIALEQVVAIGDGANDLPMLAKAGMGIAYHAKEKVKKQADHRMNFGPMTSILYFFGIPGSKEY